MNMFAKAWKVPAKTSTPIESHQVMGKTVPTVQPISIMETPVKKDINVPLSVTVEPTPVIETPVGPDINVATIAAVIQENNGNAYLN